MNIQIFRVIFPLRVFDWVTFSSRNLSLSLSLSLRSPNATVTKVEIVIELYTKQGGTAPRPPPYVDNNTILVIFTSYLQWLLTARLAELNF